jgi:hypothetical protein
METKFTQGQWKIFLQDEDIFIETEQKTEAIATIVGGIGNKEDEANAKLIIASPNLLRACNFALQGIRNGQVDELTVKILEDAISKALS